MPGYLIRSALPADTASLKSVIEEAYAPWLKRLEGLPDVAAGLDFDIAEHDVQIAVRADDGAVLGGIVLTLSGTAHVNNLAVSPHAGGQGIGGALLAAAEEVAREAGFAELNLATHKDMIPTLRFYERNGWAITGREGPRCFLSKVID